jgi:hypothetical protein
MATTPSTLIRIQTSSPKLRLQPDVLVTNVTRTPAIPIRRPVRSALFSLAKEPEDARLTGGTRSLERRLLALNLGGLHAGTDAA